MKKSIILLILIVHLTQMVSAQAPESFKYQAVVRNSGNSLIVNQAVGIKLVIQQGNVGGTTVYSETFSATTNAYGLVSLEIGTGAATGDFASIDWANGPYFIETSVDVAGGTSFSVIGTSQLLSVPFALYAKSAETVVNDMVNDADADPANEIETWSTLSGIPSDIADGDNVDDADADPTNEIETWSTLTGIPTDIADGDNVDDADADPANEIETWSTLSGIPSDIADGDNVDDADANPSNEIELPTAPVTGSVPFWNGTSWDATVPVTQPVVSQVYVSDKNNNTPELVIGKIKLRCDGGYLQISGNGTSVSLSVMVTIYKHGSGAFNNFYTTGYFGSDFATANDGAWVDLLEAVRGVSGDQWAANSAGLWPYSMFDIELMETTTNKTYTIKVMVDGWNGVYLRGTYYSY